ncbi:hypothetical protein AVEN_150607-1 [Araneus ventricosus]|uniref:Uncharacterized protein n=1 Tax=Araneus ventricosus TaxID=182803 RepID=A0A4Y2GMA1_ARAVE|nr:hypothetical protein AVEN_150607-1 [Araneus ventricosus]
MDFDRHRSRQKSAPTSDNESKYYFSDVGDAGRSKSSKQLRRRKNPEESDAKESHKGKGFPSDKRDPKYQRAEEKEKHFPDHYQLRSEPLRQHYTLKYFPYYTEIRQIPASQTNFIGSHGNCIRSSI